jgi:hypothetical protein
MIREQIHSKKLNKIVLNDVAILQILNLQDCHIIKLQIGSHDDTVKKQQQKVQKLTQ